MSIQEFIEAHKEMGRYFFSEKAMDGFSSKIETDFYPYDCDQKFFVTSEQDRFGNDNTRYYTVRVANLVDLQVRTIEFNAHRSLRQAVKWIEQCETIKVEY